MRTAEPAGDPRANARSDSSAGQMPDLVGNIVDLQTRLTYQEDEIQQLNRVLEQQRTVLDQHALQIEQLRRLVVSLSEALREQVADPPPPHY
jgi:SlyX protein